jgi:hypothetical protein
MVVGFTPLAAQDPVVEVVGQGVISTDRNETFPAEDPTTGALWFSVYDSSFDAQTIMFAERTASGWAEPDVAPFSGHWSDRAARDLSGRLVVSSSLPRFRLQSRCERARRYPQGPLLHRPSHR